VVLPKVCRWIARYGIVRGFSGWPVTSSPEPPFALVRSERSRADQRDAAEQCEEWHRSPRPGSTVRVLRERRDRAEGAVPGRKTWCHFEHCSALHALPLMKPVRRTMFRVAPENSSRTLRVTTRPRPLPLGLPRSLPRSRTRPRTRFRTQTRTRTRTRAMQGSGRGRGCIGHGQGHGNGNGDGYGHGHGG
jgi:hypothetical protein